MFWQSYYLLLFSSNSYIVVVGSGVRIVIVTRLANEATSLAESCGAFFPWHPTVLLLLTHDTGLRSRVILSLSAYLFRPIAAFGYHSRATLSVPLDASSTTPRGKWKLQPRRLFLTMLSHTWGSSKEHKRVRPARQNLGFAQHSLLRMVSATVGSTSAGSGMSSR